MLLIVPVSVLTLVVTVAAGGSHYAMSEQQSKSSGQFQDYRLSELVEAMHELAGPFASVTAAEVLWGQASLV